MQPFTVGPATFSPRVEHGELRSLGRIQIAGTHLRSDAVRFLPWFDSYAGDVFRRFRLDRLEQDAPGGRAVLHLTAISDPDVVFMEKRDASGDAILRQASWDAEPIEAALRIVIAPAAAEEHDGHAFTGFRYHYEYDHADLPIHRLLDRQTWELGGASAGNHLVCRNLFDLPRKTLGPGVGYSTTGLDNYVGVLPGNLWGRWSLIQPFDMQYGPHGALIATFDRCSLIRTVVESQVADDFLKVLDFHYFESATTVATNPKTVLYSPDILDHVDGLNLWTRIHDRDRERFRAQYQMRDEGPPRIIFSQNVWRGFTFDETYEHAVDQAALFGADVLFIDPCWQNGETLERTVRAELPADRIDDTVISKVAWQNMCCTLDFEVSEPAGGEDALRRLCDRAAAKGVRITSWMSTHYTPWTTLKQDPALREHGLAGIFAAKESGRHPDTGYTGECWTANLNNEPLYDRMRSQVMGVCERTGLSGYLWDSYCNLGWWQVDYSAGSMRPQFDRMAQLYADLVNAGHVVHPEAIVSFSNNSTIGLHGGNVYAGDLLGYSYCTLIGLKYAEPGGEKMDHDAEILRGNRSIDLLFRCVSHLRVPGHGLWEVPEDERDPAAFAAIQTLYRVYREQRHLMQRRTVLHDDRGVRYDNDAGTVVFFAYHDQGSPVPGPITHAATGQAVDPQALQAHQVYLITPTAD